MGSKKLIRKIQSNFDYFNSLSTTYGLPVDYIKSLAKSICDDEKQDLSELMEHHFGKNIRIEKEVSAKLYALHDACCELMKQSDVLYKRLINCEFIYCQKTGSFEFYDNELDLFFRKNGEVIE